MEEARRPDGFISYRRRDGARLARYLARALRAYRLPGAVRRRLERNRQHLPPLLVYMDTARAEPTEADHQERIQPALRSTNHLIIVASPSVAKPLRSGEPNCVDRETRDFLRLRSGRGLLAVHARGSREPGLPPSLGPHPRVELVDLGIPAPWRLFWAPAARRARWAVHQCAAALYDVPAEQMQHVEQAVRRNENMRGVLRACVALTLVAAAVALFAHRARKADGDAHAWATEAAAARERGDAAAGARAVLAALALRPALGPALAERFAWQARTAPEPWTRPVDRFRVEAAADDGKLVGTVQSAHDPGGTPDGRVKGLRPASPPPTAGILDPARSAWTPFEQGVVPVHAATPSEHGVWVAVVTEGVCTIRPRSGGDALLRFGMPRGQSLLRVALHVASKRCWIATRDEGGAFQRHPLGRIYRLPRDSEDLTLVKAERNVTIRLRLSRDGGRVLWTLRTGIVRAARSDAEEPSIQSIVEIGMGTPNVAGFVGSTQRVVVVDGEGRVQRETKIGAAALEPVLGKPLSGVGRPPTAAFHPWGALAAVATNEGVRLVVLDGSSAQPPPTRLIPLDARAPLAGAAFSADGKRLVVTDRDGRLRLVGPTDDALRRATRARKD